MEEPFWIDLKEIAAQRGLTLSALVTEVDTCRHTRAHANRNLSSACRLFVLGHKDQQIGRLLAEAMTGALSQKRQSTADLSGVGLISRGMSDASG